MIIKNKQKSFTLIELLVVIVIIGILVGVIMISTSSSIDKANFAKAQAFSSTVQNELLSNLVSEWTFDNSSNIGEDTWGNNNGTLYGAAGSQNLPQLQSASKCVFGTCLKFDGVDDYIDLGSGLKEFGSNGNFALMAWVKTKSANGGIFMRTYNGHWRGRISFCSDSMSIYDRSISNYIVPNSNEALNDDWHFLTAVFDRTNGKMSFFIDGALKDSKDWDGCMESSVDNGAFIGLLVKTSGVFECIYKGLIDDVRIYNAALSSSQIKQNYVAGLNSMLANGNISKEEYNERINNLAYNDNNE